MHISTVILWMSYKHNEKFGPFSDTALARKNAEKEQVAVDPSVNSVTFSRSRSQSTRRARQAELSRQSSAARRAETSRQVSTAREGPVPEIAEGTV
jgi:hypothetical protein